MTRPPEVTLGGVGFYFRLLLFVDVTLGEASAFICCTFRTALVSLRDKTTHDEAPRTLPLNSDFGSSDRKLI